MQIYKILGINLGSTSSKVAYFENDSCVVRETIQHSSTDLSQFNSFWEQETYRKDCILDFLKRNAIKVEELDAITTWGGHTKPTEDGIYRINDVLLKQVKSEKYGHHPCDLGPCIAFELAKKEAFVVDPPTIDEMQSLAKFSGLKGIERKSRMQTLNQKAIAKRYARDISKEYQDLNLIIVHMGGGTSVVAHKAGKMIDTNNGLDGDGPFGANRSGTLPVGDVIDMCYAGEFSKQDMRKKITGKGGLVSYLAENDVRTIESKIASGDTYYKEVYDAMLYQTSKEIGSMATVLFGQVDAILITGGIANSVYAINEIRKRTEFIAEVIAYPGELEMESIGISTFHALIGKEKIKELSDEEN